ncbi:DUF402 domain-containing protein [Microbacterium sp.]|uniref:DUF402 domain-containing protein n=1 Tax=Microbacterium sp. TaxID=51671 RepID=UPI003F7112F6
MSAIPVRPEPGTRLVFRWRKWDGGPHWAHDCIYLGSDEWGDWFGQPTGWRSHRPGRDFTVDGPNVTLLPPNGEYVVTINQVPPAKYRIYIDISWDAKWEGDEPTGIDMDLDVVLAVDERGLFIDDQDEWAEHRVAYGYPLEIVDKLEARAVDLERRVDAGEPPFDTATGDRWLARLAALPIVE